MLLLRIGFESSKMGREGMSGGEMVLGGEGVFKRLQGEGEGVVGMWFRGLSEYFKEVGLIWFGFCFFISFPNNNKITIWLLPIIIISLFGFSHSPFHFSRSPFETLLSNDDDPFLLLATSDSLISSLPALRSAIELTKESVKYLERRKYDFLFFSFIFVNSLTPSLPAVSTTSKTTV